MGREDRHQQAITRPLRGYGERRQAPTSYHKAAERI